MSGEPTAIETTPTKPPPPRSPIPPPTIWYGHTSFNMVRDGITLHVIVYAGGSICVEDSQLGYERWYLGPWARLFVPWQWCSQEKMVDRLFERVVRHGQRARARLVALQEWADEIARSQRR